MSSALSSQINTGELLTNACMTVMIGLVVIFAVLLVLTFVFWLFGVVAGSGKKPAAPQPSAAPPVSAPAPSAPATQDGVPDEVVAVIAAAVAAMSDGTTQYTVRRITAARSTGTRPIWAAAGLAESTQPF